MNRLDSNMFVIQPSPDDERDFTLPLTGSDVAVDDFVVGGDITLHKVYDQGKTSMCAGFASAGIQQFYDEKNRRFSPAFIYGNRFDNGEHQGEGAYTRDVLKDWLRDGICLFNDLPMIDTVENCISAHEDLPQRVKDYARMHRIEAFYRVSVKDIQGIFELMQMFDLPIIAGIPLYDSFSGAFYDKGIVPVPNQEDKFLGGHAVRFVGKKTIDGMEHIVMPNSWGDDIPDAGMQYLPIDYPIWEAWLPLPYVPKIITLTAGEENYFVDEQMRTMDTTPINLNGRVYVPLRFVVEAIGNVYVEWDEDERTARIYRGGDVLHFREGDDGFFAEVGLRTVKYEDDPEREGVTVNLINEDGRMMVPVRALCEFFGFDVDYDNDTKIITISNY